MAERRILIEEYLGEQDDLLTEAMDHPTLAPKRKPTIEVALKTVLTLVERRVRENIAASVLPELQHMYDMYGVMYGERNDLSEAFIMRGEIVNMDDWESGLDDAVEALLEPYQVYLSADWLGNHTIDTRLWEEGALERYAADVGKEVYKQLSYGKTPAQTLSNAGILQSDVDLYLTQHLASATEEQDEPMAENTAELQSVIAKIATYVGSAYDPTVIYDDLDLVTNDDDILADGAGGRLGIEHNDVVVLQLFAMDHPEDAADELARIVGEAVAAGNTKEPGKPGRKPKPKPENAVANALSPKVFELLSNHSAAKDTDMAKGLGVSRGTLTNYRTGQSPFAPDAEQYATLRGQVVADVNGLLQALALIDGTEPMAVS